MRLGSLFDGSGGFCLAGSMNGITPVWSSEIEPYPLRVTAARFTDVQQLGDVTKINGAEIEPVDVITFGSPCQDLSVAGKQLGIHDGQRSNLFFEAIRIIKEMRNADTANGRSGVDIRPRFAVWENVPGAFSSNKGADFQAVLQAIASVRENDVSIPQPKKWGGAGCVMGDGWSIAWRVYDAQYWGVPQRRKRIYLVADFASERAGEILFERESVRGDSAQGRAEREGTAADAERSAGGSGVVGLTNRGYVSGDTAETLRAESHMALPCVVQEKCVAGFKGCMGAKAGGIGYEIGSSPTLTAGQESHIVYALQGNGIDWADTAGCNGSGWRTDEMYTLNTIDRPAVVFEPGAAARLNTENRIGTICPTLRANMGDNLPGVCYDARGNGCGSICPTLTGNHQSRITDYTAIWCQTVGSYMQFSKDVTSTLMARDYKDPQVVCWENDTPLRKYIVRRLTPLECCRLQGFPDWWEDGVDGSDSARYKMWGNGIALPCAFDVLRRIRKASDEP